MKKLFLVLILFFALLGFIGHTYLTGLVAENLERVITKDIGIDQDITVQYADLTVNLFTAKIHLKDPVFYHEYEDWKISGQSLYIGLSHTDLLNLLIEEELGDLKMLSLAFEDFLFQIDSDQIKADNWYFKYKGDTEDLTLVDINQFPVKEHEIKVTAQGVSVYSELFEELQITSEIQDKMTIDKLSFSMDYNPLSKRVDLRDLVVTTPVTKLNYSGYYDLGRDRRGRVNLLKAFHDLELNLIPEGLEWGKLNQTGTYSMEFLTVDLRLEQHYSDYLDIKIPQGVGTFEIKGLKREYYTFAPTNPLNLLASLLNKPNQRLTEVVLDRFIVDYQFENNNLQINSELLTSEIKATFAADIDIDEYNFEDSFINSASLRVRELSEELTNLLWLVEVLLGVDLVWDEDMLAIEVSGQFNNPQIKGLRY